MPPVDRSPLRAFLKAAVLCAAGCTDTSLDTLDGVQLGEPRGAVWGVDEYGTAMVVLSDFPHLCESIENLEPPGQRSWWVVSVWTDGALREDTRLSATGFASITQRGQLREYSSQEAELEIDDIDDPSDDTSADDPYGDEVTVLEGTVSITFQTGDQLQAHFEADSCSAPLFRGM